MVVTTVRMISKFQLCFGLPTSLKVDYCSVAVQLTWAIVERIVWCVVTCSCIWMCMQVGHMDVVGRNLNKLTYFVIDSKKVISLIENNKMDGSFGLLTSTYPELPQWSHARYNIIKCYACYSTNPMRIWHLYMICIQWLCTGWSLVGPIQDTSMLKTNNWLLPYHCYNTTC